MTRISLFLAVLLMCGVAAETATQSGQESQPIEYESYCKLDRAQRDLVLAKLSSQDRAAQARIQLERWLTANAASLTPAQVFAAKERIRRIKPLEYSGKVIEQNLARAKAFETGAQPFSREQLVDMSLAGPCFPKSK